MLMVASVASMIDQFTMNNIYVLQKMGYKIEVAANFQDGNTSSIDRMITFKDKLNKLGIKFHQIDFSRNVLNIKSNIDAYNQLKEIIDANNYDFIHSHSPIGGAISRIIAGEKKIQAIYTAHGFHFYKKAPLLNWIIYYPVEWILSMYTTVLITINNEDFRRAKKMNANEVILCPGIGLDTEKFERNSVAGIKKRNELEIDKNTIVILSIGELIKRKNHVSALKSLSKIRNENFVYIICGKGPLERKLKKISKSLRIDHKVKFLGFRTDIADICSASDIFMFPSFQEGLPVSVMEAMASELPIVCSNIRGHVDLITENQGGFLISAEDTDGFSNAILELMENRDKRINFGLYNKKIIKKYDSSNVNTILTKIYSSMDN